MTFKRGDRVVTVGRRYALNGQVGVIDSEEVDEGFGPYHYVQLDDGGRVAVWDRHLKKEEDSVKPGPKRVPSALATTSVTAGSAFKEGHEVQFTVTAAENGSEYVVGCKKIGYLDLLPAIHKLERDRETGTVALTLRGIVRDGRITLKDQWVDKHDLDSYGRDIRVISTEVEEKKPDVTVTLTHAQAEALGALEAKIAGQPNGYRGHAQEAATILNRAAGYVNFEDNPAYQQIKDRFGIRFD